MKYSNDDIIEVLNRYFKVKDLKPSKIKNILKVDCCIDNDNKSTITLIDKYILRLKHGHSGRVFSFDLRIIKHPWVFHLSRWFIKFFINTGSYNMSDVYYHSRLFKTLIECCGNHSEVILYYGFNGVLYDEETEMISLNFSYFENEFCIQFPKDKSHLVFMFKNNSGGECFSCNDKEEFCEKAADILDREFP